MSRHSRFRHARSFGAAASMTTDCTGGARSRGGQGLPRRSWLVGTSALALLVLGGASGALARPFGSSAAVTSAPAVAGDAASAASQQAAAVAKQSATALARATQAIQALQAAQSAARSAAAASQRSIALPQVVVPNGLAPGGLQMAPGAVPGSDLWKGANAPTQTLNGEQANVNIKQTSAQAILNWQTFNVGARTTLTFDQQGNSSWTALNRVTGNFGPSQILGNIKADGQVLVINQNGIIFGGASQVNVGSLIASSAGITDAQFLAKGIYSTQSGSNYLPSFNGAGGKIVVENGALITTRAPASVTSGGGFVALLGTGVDNAGTIITPKGQALLAAGDDFVLRPGYGTTFNQASTTRGSEVASLFATGSTSGAVSNSGLIFAQQGDITLAGRSLVQDGLLMSTTSVNQRGTIHLLNSATDAVGSVTLTQNSIALILPELESTDTALNSQRDALVAASGVNILAIGQFNNLSTLSDRKDRSRVEIVTGGVVDFQSGSLTMAQGGQVAVSAGKRVFTERGSSIDVSGTNGTVLAMSANAIKVNIQGNELRDSPQNRDSGTLFNANVWIDPRSLILVPAGTGGYASDRYYTAGGLLEVGGYLANTGHRIGEWTAVGGTITLSAREVIAQQGSTFNLSGGSVQYQSGYMQQTFLVGSDGRTYNINNAPANLTYVAVANGFVVQHKQGGKVDSRLTEVYLSPFGKGAVRWEDGYTVGRDAGSLILSTPTPIFEGTILADVVTGERQLKARPAGVTDGYKLTQDTVALNGQLRLGAYGVVNGNGFFNSDVRFGDVASITSGLSANAALPSARANTAWFDTSLLNAQKLGGLDIVTGDTITVQRTLTLADGGQVSFMAPVVDFKAGMTARSGLLTVDNYFKGGSDRGNAQFLFKNGSSSINLHDGATLDLRGIWVNALLNPLDTGKLAYLNGGSVQLKSTYNVTLTAGSLIDVSSGGAVLRTGKTAGGRGGNVTLITEDTTSVLKLDGGIRGYGVNGGGTLTVNGGAAIGIGGKLLAADGVLGAGEKAPTDLVLLQDYEVKAGSVLPVDYSYVTRVALPGEAIGTSNSSITNVTLAADWVPPRPAAGSIGYVISTNIGTFGIGPSNSLPVIPAGTVITGIPDRAFPSSYVVPGNVFPNGLPILDKTVTIAAGNMSPVDFTVARGTRLAAGTNFNSAVTVGPTTTINPSLMQSGFSSYDINGGLGLVVAAGTKLDVTMPVYRFTDASFGVATGADPVASLALWTPPLYQEDAVNSRLIQRAGASLTLRSTQGVDAGLFGSGLVDVRAGAMIGVDPGRSIGLQAADFTIDGTLTAPSGTIALTQPGRTDVGSGPAGLIWIGDRAVLDVAARAATATSASGQTYGVVTDGGSILIGGAMDWEKTGQSAAPNAFVVIRPGALLDASGASAILSSPASGLVTNSIPLAVASNGGVIVVKSSNGLYLDGTLRAAAGGANAAGGTLALALETLNYPDVTYGDVLRHREFVLSSIQGDSALAGAASIAETRAGLITGTARLGVDRVHKGGFDNLSLLVDGLLAFDGSVTLAMNQSLRLYAGAFALSESAGPHTQVSLSAPYVRLAGVTRVRGDHRLFSAVRWGDGYGDPTQQASDAVFSVTADLIDLRDSVVFGVRQDVSTRTSLYTVDRRGFALLDLTSRGDIRVIGNNTAFATPGDIMLTAAQIYPATGAGGTITAGYTKAVRKVLPGSVLTIRRYDDTIPDMPFSAFGSLGLAADTVNQGGIVRAPLGMITLGITGGDGRPHGDAVNLLPGSITSVSGAGLVMPYGGTLDGLVYRYDGLAIVLDGAGGMYNTGPKRGIQLSTTHLNVEAGAVLDLSGGGELTGAGFVSGRGGSVDILTTPLVNSNPGYTFSSNGNAVYAIVPGSAGAYAPVVQEAGYGAPLTGQRITIPAGVPGLPAGTYTLMPSSYALLPGAFRVELGGNVSPAMSGAVAAGNGSYVTNAYLGIANTSIRSSLPNQVIITSANAVRQYSSHNEMGYNAFARADAARIGVPRAMLTVDAKALDILLAKPEMADVRSQLRFDGDLRMSPAAGSDGFGGTVNARGLGEILAAGQSADPGLQFASVYADELSKLDAPRLVLNGTISVGYGQTGRFANIGGSGNLIVRSGARIAAAEVILTGSGITIEEGASISTVGRGPASYDSSDGFVFSVDGGVLALSNGWINLLQTSAIGSGPGASITVGGCVTVSCNRTTTLVSEGTLAVATSGAFSIASNVSYGTRNLVLGLSTINLGENAALATAAASGHLPTGLGLNQGVLAQLLAGNTATGAPALETLVLNARDAVNIFGAVTLDASKVGRLVLGTPAIYGYGREGDTATIRAGEFIWTGSAAAPGAAMADILGGGTLDIAAKRVVFGYAPNSRPSSTAVDNRLALGFANVSIAASELVTSNGKGTLSVYQTQGVYTPGAGYQYTGGDLTITAPLLTGESGSVNRITAGGDISVMGAGRVALPKVDALGAQIDLTGFSIRVDTSVVLPSGRLVLTATGEIALGDDSRLDLSGRAVQMFDVTKYSWGGDLVLTSTAGNVRQSSGAIIDLSAQQNRGGTMVVTALDAGAGHVDLAGTIRGGATGQYDAGGTLVPFDAAELTVRAQILSDFAGLNQRLNTGSVFGARRFQIKQGDLVIGDEVKARNVEVTLDGGNLTVNGTIDASGFQVGAIRLAAMGDLTVNGKLDAHGTGLRFDSYGKIIDAPNRAIVDLTTRKGMVTLTGNAAIDLRAGTEVAYGSGPGQNDGVSRGSLNLNAPRLGGSGGQGGVDSAGNGANDVAVNVIGTPQIRGAKIITVNAFRIYDDAPLADAPDVTGHRPQEITQDYLDGIVRQDGPMIGGVDPHNTAFIDAALANRSLSNKLAGLGNYHLRPGVEIVSKVSADNPNGDLTVAGDIDLSRYRYGPGSNRNDPALYGFGEPGTLAIRAAGDLNIRGSINDGFAPPAVTPDDNSWLLNNGVVPFGGDLVLPTAITLDGGTLFRKGVTLNYDLPATFNPPAGTVLPVRATLAGPLTLSAGTVVGAAIYNADGSVAYAAGAVLPSAVTLTAGMQLGAGTVLRSAANIAALIWPKGIPLPSDMTSTGPLTLAAGSLIPSMTDVRLLGGHPVNLRPMVAGRQGRNWAVAPMLGAGATSWGLQMVAGADLGSADRRAVNPASKGAIRLADTHYVMGFVIKSGDIYTWTPESPFYGDPTVPPDEGLCGIDPSWCIVTSGGPATVVDSQIAAPAFSVIRTGIGDLDLVAAGDIRMNSLYGVYTAGTASSVDPAYNGARAPLADGTLIGALPPELDYSTALASYRAWYPDHGGNVLIAAGGDLVGDVTGQVQLRGPASVITGNWLWRQGSGTAAVDAAIPTAWWINFGTYAANTSLTNALAPNLVGFTGIGALGGGNVAIRVDGEAGAIALRGDQTSTGQRRSQGLVVAVGSTGRVGADGSLALTGGGDIDMRIAGALNPNLELTSGTEIHALPGALINLRGALHVAAESIGGIKLIYRVGGGLNDAFDPRGIDPFTAMSSDARSGITLVPGDSAVYLETRGDLVLGGAGDPGRSQSPNRSAISIGGAPGAGESWFTLWTDHTAINLMSAGGNLTPTTSSSENPKRNSDQNMADGSFLYPSILRAAALGGSMYYGVSALSYMRSYPDDVPPFVTLAPSSHGSLEMLARDSIYGGQYAFSMSGSDVPLPTPFNPAFVGSDPDVIGSLQIPILRVTNTAFSTVALSLFAFGPNTATLGLDRAPDADPVRFYARDGDVVGLRTGETLTSSNGLTTWYSAAAPLMVRAGRDIVGAGLAPGVTTSNSQLAARSRGNLIVHSNPDDVSIVSAGRDIIYANFDIAGPGTLEVSAGRNLYQADKGAITSIGPIAIGDNRPGASIMMQAGVGASGPNYTALLRYLDPANLLPAGTPLDGSGKVAKTYEKELASWLKALDGFEGTPEEVRAHFDTLTPDVQHAFLRTIYFAELTAGGREYNDPDSSRHGSYLRGRNAIAALFPDTDADGKPIVRQGDITMFDASGVRTIAGGDIQMFAPGGKLIIGVEGQVPPASSGLVTQGDGDIQLYAKGSVLLGLSRIMTTFGGNIVAWSAEGDINAGRGSKTTQIYTPPKREYDNYGRVKLSPQAPVSGAGIASLNPIPEVPPGDIDLIAPLGTIDVGEAGIRVSGNLNLAALQIVNAANIQAQGTVTGVPTVQAPPTATLTAASNATAATQVATPPQANKGGAASVIIVEVLGYGGGDGSRQSDPNDDGRRGGTDQRSQSQDSAYQVLGAGEMTVEQAKQVIAERRRQMP